MQFLEICHLMTHFDLSGYQKKKLQLVKKLYYNTQKYTPMKNNKESKKTDATVL